MEYFIIFTKEDERDTFLKNSWSSRECINKRSGEAKYRTGLYKYKYNGKELQEELGLNVYDYGNRLYDYAKAVGTT